MTRRKIELQNLDVSSWPGVAFTELDGATRTVFQRRFQAIEQYIGGESVKSIELATGVDRSQLYRLMERCQSLHPDGRSCLAAIHPHRVVRTCQPGGHSR